MSNRHAGKLIHLRAREWLSHKEHCIVCTSRFRVEASGYSGHLEDNLECT